MINEAGKTYGQLTVINRCGIDTTGDVLWFCVCSCGKEISVRGSVLRSGQKSCGCTRLHGMSRRDSEHPIYRLWKAMKWRCNPKNPRYKDYSKRGIYVCDDWQTFMPFYLWAKDKYQKELQLDRVDNDGGYTPENCRFTTAKVNSRNRRDNHIIEIDGVEKTLAEWCELSGLNHSVIQKRLKRGWSGERLIAPISHQ